MTSRGSRIVPGAWIAFSLALSLGLPTASPVNAQTTVDPELDVETIVSDLDRPTTMAFVAPDDFLFLEKDTGRVRRVLGGALQAGDALDVDVANNSERGLLGIAVNTESPPGVFLYYTEATSQGGTALANRVYRYDWNADAMLANVAHDPEKYDALVPRNHQMHLTNTCGH